MLIIKTELFKGQADTAAFLSSPGVNALANTYWWLGDSWTECNKEISSVSSENISQEPKASNLILLLR